MQFELVTLLGKKVDTRIYEAIIPTPEGDIAVFPSHEDLITLATPGVISVRVRETDADDAMDVYAVSSGVVEISGEKIRVLVDEAESSDEISEEDARVALARAEKLRAEAKDQIELDKAHQLVDRHAVRLKVADLRRRKRR